ncbi:MAG: type IV pili methyl-accepting chemotaxis transducer N-terminal domain-containing protein [Campylobacterota bacterium]|nr:type IV pili methyl-accepting chemotaxis transducer N-terminal domain-containing protein [Campylobacterota bacterium]
MTQKTSKISTKIKIIGASLVLLMLALIGLTIYLNQKNVKDALIINIAGKERMLTQKISKNIFYLYQSNVSNFNELDNAVEEFIYSLNSLKDGNELRGIQSAPTDKIAQQISKILILWNSFNKNVQEFKKLLVLRNDTSEKLLKSKVAAIYSSNNHLLTEVDYLVTLYTNHSEFKTQSIKNFQYGGAFILFILIIYSILQLRIIEAHAEEFLKYSKTIIEAQVENKPLEIITIDAESEIVEATDTLNSFICKINDAMEYSAEAVEKSQLASEKLEEITDEFDKIIDEMQDTTDLSSQISKSEDIAIQSSEDLLKTTKKLADLKQQLDSLLISCR